MAAFPAPPVAVAHAMPVPNHVQVGDLFELLAPNLQVASMVAIPAGGRVIALVRELIPVDGGGQDVVRIAVFGAGGGNDNLLVLRQTIPLWGWVHAGQNERDAQSALLRDAAALAHGDAMLTGIVAAEAARRAARMARPSLRNAQQMVCLITIVKTIGPTTSARCRRRS